MKSTNIFPIIVLLAASVCFNLLCHSQSIGQTGKNYSSDSDLLPKEFHIERRALLRSILPDSSCAILFSNPERIRSADTYFEYHQDPDFYYLTGLLEPNAVLVIWKNEQSIRGVKTHEVLFVQSLDPSKEQWTGKRIGVKGAGQMLGFSHVFRSEEFDTTKGVYTGLKKILYKGFPKGLVNDRSNHGDLSDLVESFKLNSGYPSALHDDYLLGKILRTFREIKSPQEIELMKRAAEISVHAHLEMMKALQPGMKEFQVEAIGEYFFKAAGARAPAYNSICGGGENSCILHYQTNRRDLNTGDLILIDMGAEYQGYAADITRTLPVSGKFTELQKKIYDLVLRAQLAAIGKCMPGNKFNDPDRAAREILSKGLIDLNVMKEGDDLGLYYPHGTSHYLGLDVHDVGIPGTLKPGMVITVEPGLYFPEGSPCDPALWNIGIRIEDDILITKDAFLNLSAGLPRQTEEIEQIMQEKSIFDQN
jgi:Xaa-Pro aminopeptidase